MAKSEKCWEYMYCPKETREKCVAYTLDCGDECWLLMNVAEGCFNSKEKGENCFNCPWFKKKNPKF